MLAFKGLPSHPQRSVSHAGYLYLEVKCLGCETQTVALVQRQKNTPTTIRSELVPVPNGPRLLLAQGRFRPGTNALALR